MTRSGDLGRDAENGIVRLVCPMCANGRPVCSDRKADGTRYSHAATCAVYEWGDDLCVDCKSDGWEPEP